ncbi:protein kinase domain-containing protein [Cellulomonas massiliensis]|uniref:protein kinase domain-containing protein n=1 Tax=Cellulomonas massiliensis TaxID=1465811 RepID=UPI0009DA4E67|nr:SIR2 family protein [Cellulomonas massiliensis]
MTFDQQDAYLALRAIVSERTRPLLVWAGSGLSAASGLPSWQGLKDRLVAAATRRAGEYPPAEAAKVADRVDQVRRSQNFWVDFKILRSILGETTYQAIIREALQPADTMAPPANYRALWRLPLMGMLTLNLDRFAAKAYAVENQGLLPIEYSGANIANVRGAMFGGRALIGNLHGVVHDSATWIFTVDDLSRLMKNQDYAEFLRFCLSFFTNIFVGISADDVAIGSHLDALATVTHGNAPSFWLTHRSERATDMWAEARGIRVIRYRNQDGSHSELAELLNDLATYVSVDGGPDDLPPVSEIVAPVDESGAMAVRADAYQLSTEELRVHLNEVAARILAPGTEESYREYQQFSDANDELIYRAWYASARPGSNDLLGYRLDEEIARGAFGRVYRATAPTGETVAVKILLDEVRRRPVALASFRRGVRSMKILRDSPIEGMVTYRAASEIPAFVAMDWIDGPTLEDLKAANELEGISDVLTTAIETVRIIRRAHMLPERILHRDIRPANIMVRDYWTERNFSSIVVLDFDLSWHIGAAERSVVFTTATGYLAPEQQVSRAKESTRSAQVDSFGFGMTLFFLAGGVHPLPNEHVDGSWPERVRSAVSGLHGASAWRSSAYRLARVVVGATRDAQSTRWDVSRIEHELVTVADALNRQSSEDVTVIAEELAARCPILARYTWDDDRQGIRFDSPTGLHVRLGGDLISEDIVLVVEWLQTGFEDRTGLSRGIRDRVSALSARLVPKWRVNETASNAGSFAITARARGRDVARALDAYADALDGALGKAAYR